MTGAWHHVPDAIGRPSAIVEGYSLTIARRDRMTAHAAASPTEIPVRRMNFSFAPDIPRHWMGGDPFETHILHALSLTFPRGEKMFIDSVRAFAARITDPALKTDVRAFIGQEGHHSREHAAFNEWITSLGLPTKEIDDFVRNNIERNQAGLSPDRLLAATCALEHFTAVLAEAFLTNPALRDACDERVRALWIWHSIEELEHKSVAFDVFEQVGGDYLVRYSTRVITMALVTLNFLYNQAGFHRKLMKADGQAWNVGSWARGIWKYWGPQGAFTKLVPAYLDYYRPSFHPWQHDTRELLARWKPYVEARAERVTCKAGTTDLRAS
jgi:predicted metal-dependent hydrolase